MMADDKVKIWYDPAICDSLDRRIMHVWCLAENLDKIEGNQNTYDWEKWSIFVVEDSVKLDGYHFSFTKPEMIALYIDMSNKLFNESLWFLGTNGNFDIHNWIYHPKDKGLYFSFIQNIAWSIIFSINALECFCNTFVVNYKDNDIIGKEKNKKGVEQDITKRDFEYRPIDKKVKEFLTQYFGVPIPTIIRNKFIKLKDLRDRLTHLKWIDIQPATDWSSQKNIRRSLLLQTKESPSEIAVQLIDGLHQTIQKPRWLRLYLKNVKNENQKINTRSF